MPRGLMIEDELAIRLPNHQILSTPVLIDAVKFYAHHGSIVKGKIDGLAVDIRTCHERIKNAHAIIQALNNLAADDGSVNLHGHDDIKQLLQTAKDTHGVTVPMEGNEIKTKFSSVQRDRLISNLHLSADEWDKETKNYSQKMQVHMQESERYLMLANQVLKYENQPKKSALAGIKGA